MSVPNLNIEVGGVRYIFMNPMIQDLNGIGGCTCVSVPNLNIEVDGVRYIFMNPMIQDLNGIGGCFHIHVSYYLLRYLLRLDIHYL